MHAWCTLYFWMYFVPWDVLCTFTFESTKYTQRYIDMYGSIFSTRNGNRVHSTSKRTFMYFWMYCVLLIVLCTSNECGRVQDVGYNIVENCDLTFAKNQ